MPSALPRRALALALLVALPHAAGCLGFGEDERGPSGFVRPTLEERPPQPPLVFGGVVVDALTGEPVEMAEARLDLAQVKPCKRQGLVWQSWEFVVAGGAFGPETIPRPNSDDFAFFLHVRAPGYTDNATFVGPVEARGDIGNLTLVLHPTANVTGEAPPGTVVALDAPPFPRLTAADESGRFAFEGARVVPAQLVVATEPPSRAVVAAPATVALNATDARGWILEGIVRLSSGAPVAADVVAWNGTQMWSAARSGTNGIFALPLPAEPVELRLEVRSPDGHYGGTRTVGLSGPPALREPVLVRPLC